MTCSYSCASVGTTAATMTPPTSLNRRPRRSRRGASWVASSSAVANRAVWNRQCSTSSSSRNIPTWVGVFPTSMASSTRAAYGVVRERGAVHPAQRLSQGGAHRVEAAVHVEDLAAAPAGEVREEEEHGAGHRRGVRGVPAERSLLLPQAGQGLE